MSSPTTTEKTLEQGKAKIENLLRDLEKDTSKEEVDKMMKDLVTSSTRPNLEMEKTEVNNMKPREEELLAEHPEDMLDKMEERVKEVSLIIEEHRKADSPLNELIPNIPIKKGQSHLFSLLEKMSTVDISDPESKQILVSLFVDVVATFSEIILDTLREVTLSVRHEQPSPLVSEEAVHKALYRSIYKTFKAVLGSTHRSMDELFKLVTSEVTNTINSVLSCCRVKDNHLVVTKETKEYKSPRDKIKKMLLLATALPQSIKEKISQSCGPCWGRRLISVSSTCCPCVYSEEEQEKEEEEEEEEMAATRRPVKNKIKLATSTTCWKAAIDAVRKILEKEASELETFREHPLSRKDQAALLRSLSNDEDIAALIVSTIEEEMGYIHSDSSEDSPTKKPCLQGVAQKIKSFFVLYFSKANFHSLLTKLCCQKTARQADSVQFVMEKASPFLKKLVSGQATDSHGCEVCVYERVSQGLTNGLYKELSQQLSDLIIKLLAPQKGQRGFTKKVRQNVNTFLEDILKWVKIQQLLPARSNPVQRVLKRICRLVSNMATPPLDPNRPKIRCLEDKLLYPSTVSVSRFQAEDEAVMEYVQKVPMATQKVAPSAGQEVPMVQSKYRWDCIDCTGLAYELGMLIFQKKEGPDFCEWRRSLEQQLELKIAEWDIQVDPDHVKKVAKAVFKDLCEGKKKTWVQSRTYLVPGYDTFIMDTIYKHLVTAPKTSRFSSFLQSVRKVFCSPCWGR